MIGGYHGRFCGKEFNGKRNRLYKKILIYEDISAVEMIKAASWKDEMAIKILKKRSTLQEMEQYNRIFEIEILMDILGEKIPSDPFELAELSKIVSKKEVKIKTRVMLDNLDFNIQDTFIILIS